MFDGDWFNTIHVVLDNVFCVEGSNYWSKWSTDRMVRNFKREHEDMIYEKSDLIVKELLTKELAKSGNNEIEVAKAIRG